MKEIHLWGVKQNNLKSIEVKIPIGSFTVVCGPSGSGKSSLAFETLYAEGQRRYIESLSNYTKQFLNKAPKPDLEGIENVPPAISIEQKNGVKSSRSTVGTTTEVVDYLRLLYEKLGKAYCPEHHITLQKDSPSSGAQKVINNFKDQRGYILVPIYAQDRGLTEKQLLDLFVKDGFLRVYLPAKAETKKAAKAKRQSTKKILASTTAKETLQEYGQVPVGEVVEINDPVFKKKGLPKDDFYLVIDRLGFNESEHGRIVDSLAQAYSASLKFNKTLFAARAECLTTEGQRLLLSEELSCSICGYKFPSISAKMFSFNSPVGACGKCNGFGNILTVDEAKVVPDPLLTLAQGAIKPFAMPSAREDRRHLKKFCEKAKIDVHTPWKDLLSKQREAIWNGNKDFYGVLGLFEYLEQKKYKMHVRVFLARHKSPVPCTTCKGTRLRPEAQQVLIHGKSISDLTALSIEDLAKFLKKLQLSPMEKEICQEILRQGISRLDFLMAVGVGYLTMDRPTKTLSGGEFQRLNLSNQLGMELSQTLYVLDEPTIGLHPRDNDRLIEVLKKLRDLGNTLVVVEHDHDVILNASHVIEMGPGSGKFGGEIIFAGERDKFFSFAGSNTVGYLKPYSKWVPTREPRPVDIEKYRYKLQIKNARGHNLKNVDVAIPLNRIVTITGVSGSGKSSLVGQTLYPILARELKVDYLPSLEYDSISGMENVKNILFIDQSPIGKTARSSPVTYLKVFDAIRTIMSETEIAKERGYSPGTFSLNVDGGRCPVCKGLGHEVIDMMFMDDIEVPCEACDGKKYRDEILDVRYKHKNILDILTMTVQEAMDFFVNYPNIRRPLSVLKEVGLEYLCLGQKASSLSGGESQRLKIAREFNTTTQKDTLYILDEPTTGLHFREVHLLLKVLNRLVDGGGSVILIEHNLEIISNSDYIIDLGPEAGQNGGHIVAEGPPQEIMNSKKSHTGKYMREYLSVGTKKNKLSEVATGMFPVKILWDKLLPRMLEFRTRLFGAIFLGAIVSLLKAGVAPLMKELTENAWANHNIELAWQLPVGLCILWVLGCVVRYYHNYWMKYIGDLVAVQMRRDLMDKYLHMNIGYMQDLKRGSAGLISHMINDINVVQNGIYRLADFLREPFLAIFSFAYVLYLDWKLTIIIFIALPLVAWVNRKLAQSLRKYSRRNQETMEDITKTLKESLDGTRIVQSYNLQEEMRNKFRSQAEQFLKTRKIIASREELSEPASESIAAVGLSALLIYIGREIFAQHLTIADMLSFIVAISFLQDSVKKIQDAYIKLQQAAVGVERLDILLSQQNHIQDPQSPKSFPQDWQQIEFKNVSFSYGEELVLRNIDLTVRRGEVVALVGGSGGGKSTMVNLLARFFDPIDGEICVGGVNVRDMTLPDLRSHIALVTQDVFLFGDSIQHNIQMGFLGKDEKYIEEAAKVANAHNFILDTANGYGTKVGDYGNRLSGGQKQRISIARAVFKDAPILILDEATSALDSESEKEVQKGLDQLMKGRTAFVIAHRLSTVAKADRILVLKDGEIIEQGTHEQLLAHHGEYFNFHQLQMR